MCVCVRACVRVRAMHTDMGVCACACYAHRHGVCACVCECLCVCACVCQLWDLGLGQGDWPSRLRTSPEPLPSVRAAEEKLCLARQVAWGCARTDAAETAGGESICSLLQPDTNQLEQTREGPGAGERNTEGQIRAGHACWDLPDAGRVKTRLQEGGQDCPPCVPLPPAPCSPYLDTQVKGRCGLQPGASLGSCPENTGPSSRPCPLPSSPPVPLLVVPRPLFSGGSSQRRGARNWAAGLPRDSLESPRPP